MSLSEDLITALDDSARRASSWHRISSGIRGEDPPDEETQALAAAFDYLLQVGRTRQQVDGQRVFEPMVRFESGEAVPPDLEDLEPEWQAIWEAAAERVREPATRARLHDLLQETGSGDVPSHARQAVQSYRELAQGGWGELDRAEALLRGLDICRKFGFDELAQSIIAQVLEFAATALSAPDPKPGTVLSLVDALVADPDCPDEVDRLLAKARERFTGAHLTENIIQMQRARASDDDRLRELDRDRVMAWIDEADKATGLTRVVHLETALRLAGDLGVTDLREVVQRKLQSIPDEELELASITSEVEIPQDVVDEYLAPFTMSEDVGELLTALLSHPPATGDVSDNEAAVERSRTEFPLQYLFPRVRLGGDGLPRWQADSEADRHDGDLAREEMLRFQVVGDLLARGLWVGGERLDPTREETRAFIGGLPSMLGGVTETMTEAFHAYWEERWTDAGFLALPCVETLARDLLLRLDVGLYQAQRGQRPGRYPPLSALIRWLRERGLDESWFRYIWTILASPAGMNLRNEIAHGFVLQLGPPHAAAILHMCVYLGSLNVEAEEDPSK